MHLIPLLWKHLENSISIPASLGSKTWDSSESPRCSSNRIESEYHFDSWKHHRCPRSTLRHSDSKIGYFRMKTGQIFKEQSRSASNQITHFRFDDVTYSSQNLLDSWHIKVKGKLIFPDLMKMRSPTCILTLNMYSVVSIRSILVLRSSLDTTSLITLLLFAVNKSWNSASVLKYGISTYCSWCRDPSLDNMQQIISGHHHHPDDLIQQ